jgi:8-oxo-dGTP diphosphatase
MKQLLVTAGVVVRDGLIMMAQRHEQGIEGGKWEFPGGKVELGEDPRRGLQRELQEELGIAVTVGSVLEVVSQVKDDRHLVLIYYRCELYRGEPVALDCQQVYWLSPDEVDLLPKPDPDQYFWERHRKEVMAVAVATNGEVEE